MIVETTIPTTWAELFAEYGENVERIPASWEEFLDWLEVVEFSIEYIDKHIIIMSYATNPHELMVGNLLTIANNLFEDEEDIWVLGSNRPVYSPEWGEESYNADLHLVKGELIVQEYRPGMTGNVNPAVIFEVISKSTRHKDWFEKLPRYKKMPSVKQIIYAEQNRPFVTVLTRIGDSDRWESVDYDKLEQSFEVLGKRVTLKKLYQKVIFTGQP